MKHVVPLAAAFGLGGATGAQAAGAAVALPLKLGSYETPSCNQNYDSGVDGPLALTRKGYDENSDQGPVTFVSASELSPHHYRLRLLMHDETNHRIYFWSTWDIASPTAFTRKDDAEDGPASYVYCPTAR